MTTSKKSPKPKKPSKKQDILFADMNSKFSHWSEVALRDLEDKHFMHFLSLVSKNKDLLSEMFMSEALNINPDEQIKEEGQAVVHELAKSLDRIYQMFPAIKLYISHREKFLNINQYHKS